MIFKRKENVESALNRCLNSNIILYDWGDEYSLTKGIVGAYTLDYFSIVDEKITLKNDKLIDIFIQVLFTKRNNSEIIKWLPETNYTKKLVERYYEMVK